MSAMTGKVAIVTGGAAGIGRAAAIAFAREGANVVVADVDAERGEKTAAEVEHEGVDAIFVPTDVSNADDVGRLVDRTIERFGRLDFAFNNAGIEGVQAPTADCTIDNWNRTIAVNLTGVYLCMRAEIPQMLAQRRWRDREQLVGRGTGRIRGHSRVHGVEARHRRTHQDGRARVRHPGRAGQCRLPGRDRHRDDLALHPRRHGRVEQLTQAEPVGRLGSPEEIADAVVWLCSDRASFVTGQAIAVDGGFVAR